jgi:hypothetical protein
MTSHSEQVPSEEKAPHLQDVLDELRWLSERFGYYTECELATLERLRDLKSASKYELNRHENLAKGMVQICRQLKKPHVTSPGTPRLRELLK